MDRLHWPSGAWIYLRSQKMQRRHACTMPADFVHVSLSFERAHPAAWQFYRDEGVLVVASRVQDRTDELCVCMNSEMTRCTSGPWSLPVSLWDNHFTLRKRWRLRVGHLKVAADIDFTIALSQTQAPENGSGACCRARRHPWPARRDQADPLRRCPGPRWGLHGQR